MTSSLVRSEGDPTTGLKALWFAADGWVPNNSSLPLLLYRHVIATTAVDCAHTLETLFDRNGWPPQWRNGIYPFHHYHANAHEVLGIASGTAHVQLGGPHGTAVVVAEGDCVLLPAGTGHCLLEASPDFLVVGAYPPGPACDLRRAALSDIEHACMAALLVPASDPVAGASGALLKFWPQPN